MKIVGNGFRTLEQVLVKTRFPKMKATSVTSLNSVGSQKKIKILVRLINT